MRTMIQSKKANIVALLVGLAALASEFLDVAPDEWRPFVIFVGLAATAIAGLFVDMTGATTQAGANKPFLPSKQHAADTARRMFDAYNVRAGGLTWDGKPIPPWGDVGDRVRDNWLAAAEAARGEDGS